MARAAQLVDGAAELAYARSELEYVSFTSTNYLFGYAFYSSASSNSVKNIYLLQKPPSLRLLYCLAFFMLFSIRAFTQNSNYFFRHITRDNGLITNEVTSILQDSRGFIWVGTLSGLQRYDGARFVTYSAHPHDPSSLQTDIISTIFEDSRHRLWIGTGNGPYLLDRSTGVFYNYDAHCIDKQHRVISVWEFSEDVQGNIWINCSSGFFRLNTTTNQFENIYFSLATGTAKFGTTLAADREGRVWFSTPDGIRYYDLKDRKTYDTRDRPEWAALFNLHDQPVASLVVSGSDIWIATRAPYFETTRDPSALYRYNLLTNTLKKYDLHRQVVARDYPYGAKLIFDRLEKDNQGNIYVSVFGRGLAVYHAAEDSFSLIAANNKEPYALHGALRFTSCCDKEGNIWIASNKGINIFNPGRQRFYQYNGVNQQRPDTPYPSFEVTGSVQTDDGDVYISYNSPEGGILRMDSGLHFKQQYMYKEQGLLKNPKNQIWCLFQRSKHLIWGPGQDRTMLQLNTRTHRLQPIDELRSIGNINTMQQDGDGNVWIGSWSRGLVRLDQTGHSYQCYTQSSPTPGYPIKNVSCLYLDADSLIWAGTTQQGLHCFDKRKNVFTASYIFDEKDRRSISNNTVTAIIPYNADTLLVATAAGINIFDKKRQTFFVISRNDGLPDNYVQSMYLDDHQNLWAGCLKGEICRINIPARSVTHFDISDGITDASFQGRPFLRLRNGNLLAATSRGFLVFNPDSAEERTPPSGVVITECKAAEKEINTDTLVNTSKPIRLLYKDNNLSIAFSSLQYSSPGNIAYYYQMEGVDKDWILADKEQVVFYNQLRGGNYLFKIKCSNRSGVSCKEETRLRINIVPPFWATWWFYLIMFLAAGSALFFTVKFIHLRREKKALSRIDYERKLAIMEMNTLRAQMNPHFIFNSLSSINTFILKNDQDNASGYLGKFSQLIRLILDSSRTEWVLLETEIKALNLYMELESLRFDKAFSYNISVQPDILNTHTMIPPLIIQPFVENAIRHGLLHRNKPGGILSVQVWKEGHQLMIRIDDNGIGREEAAKIKKLQPAKHKSQGMEITAERLAVLNTAYKVNAAVAITDLKDAAGRPSGTSILITLLYKTHAYIDHR